MRLADDAAVDDGPPPGSPAPVAAPAPAPNPNPPALKILILEDEPGDAELMQRELRKAGLDFTARRVDNRADFALALETFAPDIVLADYKLPGFDGAEALAHVRHVHPEIPVVIVTGTLGDEAAILLLEAGAKDYVLKSNLVRLRPALGRAISVERGIRARKAAEQAMRASNTLLETVERIASIGGWDYDVAHDALVWSDEVYRIYGCDPVHFVPSVPGFIAMIHPDDRARVQDAITASVQRNAPFDVEFRIVRPDGTQRFTHARAELALDRTGRLVSMTGTSHDITERKQADDRLREEEAKFRGLVEQNVAGIVIIRADGTIGYINPYYARLAGYTPEELIGRPLFDLVPESARAAAAATLRSHLESQGGFVQMATQLQARDGSMLEVLVNASPTPFEGGPASLAVILDVTERNRTQRELAATAAILATEDELTPDGILVVDHAAKIITVNRRFREIFEVPADLVADAADEPLLRWVVGQVADGAAFLARVRYLYEHPEETTYDEIALKDGRVLDRYSASIRRPDGGDTGRVWFFRDVTERKKAESALIRLNRTLRTLSRGNEVLVRAGNEPALLDEMCHVIVETGGYRMAWVGALQRDEAKSITPIASAGEVGDYLENPEISWAAEPRGQGPHGRAVRSGEPQITQDLGADPSMAPWRDQARESGFASSVVFPLTDASGVFAVLTIDAAETGAFDADELKLLQELASDLAFGIRGLREHTAHEALNLRWQASLEATVGAIANTVEMRDPYTAGHQQRVARLAVAMAREMALPEPQIQGLYLAGIIHDVGKIDVPAEILSKPGKLSRLQFQLIQVHAQAGYDIVKGVDFPWPIAQIILQHHERLDGSGYPQGLKAEAILAEAKILAVADAVEAMMSHRPYRAALGINAALAEIDNGKGRLFDPAAVAACTALFRDKQFSFC